MTFSEPGKGGLRGWFRRTFVEPLESVDDEMRRHQSESHSVIDRKTAWVMLSATVALALQRYVSSPVTVLPLLRLLPLSESTKTDLADRLMAIDASRFGDLAWWSGSTLLAYIVIPFFVVKVVLRERLVDFGLGIKNAASGWPIYAAMAVVMLPIVFGASKTVAFLNKYPFFRLAPGETIPPEFWKWEILYALQFVGLEFFFRGFMIHGLKHRFGSAAVLVMVTPYCMIHFGKPMAETFAAIAAGLVLGVMSLKTGTIWLGAALHIMVAWTMDALALYRGGFLG